MDGLDAWITGNYGEDQFMDDVFCHQCVHFDVRSEKEGGYCNKFAKFVEDEDYCEDFEAPNYGDDEPDYFDEWREEHGR